mmetsp:Transcript_34571/g.81503  ORF Transcript_34571/g.81503 Transcript_34571/m.81503 type:complete len:357 (+) Transcript_34571:77-1147(+)
MRYYFGSTIVFVAMGAASAYIEESVPGRKLSSPPTRDWSSQSLDPKIRIRPMCEESLSGKRLSPSAWTDRSSRPSSKIRIRPLGEPEFEEQKLDVDASVEATIRREYGAWAIRYGKVKDENRFEIFKKNFILQMEMNRRNGQFFLLNEYGDLTKEEYLSLLRSSERSEIDEQNEFEVSGFSSTLPPAPIVRLEDLTQEVLDSAMESSRRLVADEQKEHNKAKKRNVRRAKFHSLIEPIGEDYAVKSNSRVLYSTPTIKSYSNVLNSRTKPLDDVIRRPGRISSGITPLSDSSRSYSIEERESQWEEYGSWEEHSFAMDFGDTEENYDNASGNDYVAYAQVEPEVYGDADEFSEWSW